MVITLDSPSRPLPRLLPYPDIVAVYDMTEQEYLDWDQEGGLADWIDGKVYQYMAAGDSHQVQVEFLSGFFQGLGQVLRAGRSHTGPYAMRTKPGRTWREPDLMFVLAEREDRMSEQGLMGPADIVVEVVSTGSTRRDREEKRSEYEDAGVREYWILDPRPRRRTIEFHVLERDAGTGARRYVRRFPDAESVYRSPTVEGLWLKPEWLWEDRPDFMAALFAVIGAEALTRRYAP